MARSELYTTGFTPEGETETVGKHERVSEGVRWSDKCCIQGVAEMDNELAEKTKELVRLREEYRAAMGEIERLKNEIQFQRGQIEAYEYCLYIRTCPEDMRP